VCVRKKEEREREREEKKGRERRKEKERGERLERERGGRGSGRETYLARSNNFKQFLKRFRF